jgi:ribokinase
LLKINFAIAGAAVIIAADKKTKRNLRCFMTSKVPNIVVIGGSFIDIAVRCSQFPSSTQHCLGTALSYTVTGAGPNQAVEAAMCGCQVHLITKVGGDPFAQKIKDILAEHKVNTDFVFTAEAKNTGTVITLVNAIGENAPIFYAGANGALVAKDIETAAVAISQADVCLIDGSLSEEVIVEAVNTARLHGAKVILNPARPLDRNTTGRELPLEYFTADILIPNLYEAADITEQSTANIHTAKLIGSDLVARGVGAAVITMGRRGCVVVDRNGADHIPAFEVELVDHTGTGDAFAGALAASYGAKTELRDAVRFASAAGALACAKFGTIEAMPSKTEIIELMQKKD